MTRIKLTAPATPDYSRSVKVDIAPNWETTALMLCAILQDGSPEGQAYARDEFRKMGQMLDKVKAAQQADKPD